MHAEHKRPLYAFCLLALAAALLVGQGLRTQALFDYFVGDRGHGSAQFAAGSTISAATEPDDAAHGTTVVAVPERRTVAARPSPARATRRAPAAQPATQAPGRSHQATGKAPASGARGGSAKPARSGRVALDDSKRTQRSDFRAANGQAKAGGKSKAKSTGKKAKKSKKAKGKNAKRHARNRRHGR